MKLGFERFEDRLQALQNKLIRSNEENKSLREAKESLTNENAKLYRKLKKKTEDIQELSKQLIDLKLQVKELDEKLRSLVPIPRSRNKQKDTHEEIT